jgi:hypothetical protein
MELLVQAFASPPGLLSFREGEPNASNRQYTLKIIRLPLSEGEGAGG